MIDTSVPTSSETVRSASVAMTDDPFRRAVMDAAADPVASGVGELLTELAALADAASTRTSANEVLQARLHWLHYGDHEPSHPFRQWLATAGHPYFERAASIPTGRTTGASHASFVDRLAAEQEALSPLRHPLFQRCFREDGDLEDLKVYLRHKWIIMLTFWRSLSEFGMRLQRHDVANLANTALVYENVFEELGTGDPAEAHMVSHFKLLQAIGVDVGWDDEPEFTETREYINFRMFCMRHPNPAWGLGSFYSQEATSLEYTLGHYDQLRRFGVSHDTAEIYHAHDAIDAEHTDEILTIINDLINDDRSRSTVLLAQQHQMHLWNAHFDRVLDRIEQRDGLTNPAGGR
ncbi:MAG: iron-containing redox enzyme family protein [Actinomycetota bacterium]